MASGGELLEAPRLELSWSNRTPKATRKVPGTTSRPSRARKADADIATQNYWLWAGLDVVLSYCHVLFEFSINFTMSYSNSGLSILITSGIASSGISNRSCTARGGGWKSSSHKLKMGFLMNWMNLIIISHWGHVAQQCFNWPGPRGPRARVVVLVYSWVYEPSWAPNGNRFLSSFSTWLAWVVNLFCFLESAKVASGQSFRWF